MDFAKKFEDLYLEYQMDEDAIFNVKNSRLVVAFYLYYHYFNGDPTKLAEIVSENNLFLRYCDDSFQIVSIQRSCTMDQTIDLITFVSESDFKTLSLEEFLDKIKQLSARNLAELIYNDSEYHQTQEVFREMQCSIDGEIIYVIRVICGFCVNSDVKIQYQQKVGELEVKNHSVYFEIVFADDLYQEMRDIDDPIECVPKFDLMLMGGENVCYFGEEHSFIAIISAKSLQTLFEQFSTRGLFASNLRFFVAQKKIDNKIVHTIKNEADIFCYLNNGIVITCEDYDIDRATGRLTLEKFSIVNGGQTTNLIGRNYLPKDFGVICKVIKNKYEDSDSNIEFLSKVAEASNTQKPIKAQDLIANRPEQRKLKIQYAAADMFLKIKRGEKIDKTKYPDAYMNATNEEVAQMLYSMVYQSPGSARNNKSKLFSDDRIYDLIFQSEYDSNFLKSLQYLKVAYASWKNAISKRYKQNQRARTLTGELKMLYSLSRYSMFHVFAMLGFLMKNFVNVHVGTFLLNASMNKNIGNVIRDNNEEFKNLIKCNDIGQISFIKPQMFGDIKKNTFFDMFNYLMKEVSLKAYEKFHRTNSNLAFSQFTQVDKYYYNFVLPILYEKAIYNNREITDLLKEFFNIEGISAVEPEKINESREAIGLSEELKEYRQQKASESSDIRSSDVLRVNQIRDINIYYPTSKDQLKDLIRMTDAQVDLYGDDVLRIVSKYIKKEDFS